MTLMARGAPTNSESANQDPIITVVCSTFEIP